MPSAPATDCFFFVPGDWDSRTGGYLYDRRIAQGLVRRGWRVAVRSPGDGYPWPDAAALAQADAVAAALPDGALVVADGLAFGALPELAARHADRLRWMALVHHPLAFESGLSVAQREGLQASERRALAHARHTVVTSVATARALAEYGVPADRITVVEPGTEPSPWAAGGGGDTLALLCVATVTARKGHAVLLQALAGLADRRWHLHCAGSLVREAHTADAAQAEAQRLGLADRVTWHGEVSQTHLEALYARADLFVLPSFHEGYGMALAEALARGLPVVACAAGATSDTVPPDAGLLVPPGDVPALRTALQHMLDAPQSRAALAAGARAAALRLPRWDEAVARFDAVLRGCMR